MARGRTLFSEHRRRAASVPVDDLSYPDPSTTSRVFDIKSHVTANTEALQSASKRHDRDFLYNLQTKLAYPPTLASTHTHTQTHIKTTPTLNHNKYFGPPPSRSAYYVAAATASPASHDSRRRTWYGPTSKRVDDFEVAAYLATPIRPPFVSRVLRAGSVPPVLPSRVSTPRWYPSTRGTSVPRWAPSSYKTYGSGRSYLQSHPDNEDIVVGVAPTVQYGDIVIGIPYRKQFMFDVQHGLDAIEDYPRIPVATRVTSPYFAHRTKTHLESPYEDVDVIPYRRATFSAPSHGGASTGASSYWHPTTTHHHVGHHRTPLTTAGSRISTYGYPIRASSVRSAPTKHEYDVELLAPPKETFSNLRLRALLARDKASQHKSLIDKFIPVDVVAETSRGLTSTIKTGPSIDFRATGSTHHHHHTPPSISSSFISSSIAPSAAPAPAAATGATSSKPFKPQISETRQRVRDLLCKSKKDPHYFD